MRRRPGTGTIEPRKQRDGSIRFMPRLPDAKRTPLGTYETRAEAETLLDAAVAELADGHVNTANTLAKYGERIFDRREKDGYRTTDTERDRWKYVVGNPDMKREPWVCATWPIKAIRRPDVLEWLRDLKELGLSRSTRLNALNTLRTVFRAALDDELIEASPAESIRIKDHGSTEDTMHPLTLEELGRLLCAADDEGRKLIGIAVGTGIRQGEQRSIRHCDVFLDGESPHLRICHGSPGKPPKNGRVRRVPLFGAGLAAMTSWTPPPSDRGLYFANTEGAPRQAGQMVDRRRWAQWLKNANIDRRVRWHDLRHTCATLLLQGELGRAWSLEELCDFLGHSSMRMTERYAKHLGVSAERAARSHTEATRHTEESLTMRDQRRGSGSNRRITVLQFVRGIKDPAVLHGLRGFAVDVLRRIDGGDPTVTHGMVIEAEYYIDAVDAVLADDVASVG